MTLLASIPACILIVIAGAVGWSCSRGADAEPAEERAPAPTNEGSRPEGATPTPEDEASEEADPQTEAADGADAGALSEERLAMGRTAYTTGNCAMCHGRDGSGSGAGPSLVAGTWHHSDGSVEGLLGVLRSGVKKADFHGSGFLMSMPPATDRIKDEEALRALAEYVLTLGEE